MLFCVEKGSFWFWFLSLTNLSLFFPGVISYTEYLFLLCILTSKYIFQYYLENDLEMRRWLSNVIPCHLISEPHAGFRIAFNMFDADGNEMVDKREFMVVWELLIIIYNKMHLIRFVAFCIITSILLTSWKKFSVRKRTERKLLKTCKDLTSRYELLSNTC